MQANSHALNLYFTGNHNAPIVSATDNEGGPRASSPSARRDPPLPQLVLVNTLPISTFRSSCAPLHIAAKTRRLRLNTCLFPYFYYLFSLFPLFLSIVCLLQPTLL